MTSKAKQIVNAALSLSPKERAAVADTLLTSLDRPDEKIDALWKKEAERRYKGYKSGNIKALSLSRVLAKYHKKKAA